MPNETLMDEILSPENLNTAYRAVKANAGAPGIDGMSVEQLAGHVREHWPAIEAKLRDGTYCPAPVRTVRIAKPDGGERMLGIPSVLDRMIQQAIYQAMGRVFEPLFSEHSYGFRPGRSAHDAIREAQRLVVSGLVWVVDIDISAFFDHVDHDRLMSRIGLQVRDKRVLRMVGRYLRAGRKEDGQIIRCTKGTPQGGPLSPLLANIYLHDLDVELEKRGLHFVRYADDCNIYVGSEKAAQRVLESVTVWIEKYLKLTVNTKKSGTGRPWERKFLGFQITQEGDIAVAPKSIERLKDKVRELFDACRPGTSTQLRDEWKRYIRGWWNYYSLAEWRRPIDDLEGWIRRHMRKYFWQRWHCTKGRQKALHRLGAKPHHVKIAGYSGGAWNIARCQTLHSVLSNARLRDYGFLVPSDLAR
jgi:RNA-directed DNA polymerase